MTGIYEQTFNKWTDKEMQLNRLHEELLFQREALLSFTVLCSKSRENLSLQEIAERERCRIRNEEFLQKLKNTQLMLVKEAALPPSPRMTTLQANYWYMVKSMKPMWEQSVHLRKAKPDRKDRSSSSRRTISLQVPKTEENSHLTKGATQESQDKKQKKKSKWTTRFSLNK